MTTPALSVTFDPDARLYQGCTLPVSDSAIRWYANVDGRYCAYDLLGNRWAGNWKTGLSKVARLIRDVIQNDF